jgi:phosphatidylinositol transfer protein SFH5
MMISTLKWREEFKVDDLANDVELRDAFSSVGHVFGKDKVGRPVT